MMPKDMEKKKKKTKQKADVFQRVFTSVTKIIQQLWLEQNTDTHRSLQGQKRMTKITEAT